MKKSLSFALLLTLFISCASPAQEALDVDRFASKMETEHPQVLDVRTAGEYQSGHLKNALQADWLNKDQFVERVKYLDKSKPVLVYCASGVRSAAAASWLKKNGFPDVQNLKGGLVAWKLAGKKLDQVSQTPQLTIDAYQTLSASADLVLVDFGAEWCPPCKQMEPILQQLTRENGKQFRLVKVDGGNDIDVMKSQQVEALPVFIVYKKGKEVWKKQGVVSLADLKKAMGL
ncbi:MAG: conjugal transfer protein TraF [Bacteroidota bacterium]|nr:conjugal transfer protein TraF [Bacteroidota bacterium]